MAKERDQAIKDIATYRKAFYRYHVEDRLEAGIVLTGTEVKSLRAGKAVLNDAYAIFDGTELFLLNLHIEEYLQGNRFNHDPLRKRKLLLHQSELRKIRGKIQERGYSMVPLRLYFKGAYVKVELGLVKGKQQFDKRESIKKRDQLRDSARQFKR